MADLEGRRVLVLGLGVSGRSAAAFCAARGARVLAADERDASELADLSALGPGVEIRVGEPFPDPAEFDLVVPSPGVPPARYRGRARRVRGDIELAYRALRVPVVAVTGTNGKSTTTLLCEAMLRAGGLRARAGGNVGMPALDLVGEPLDIAVLEVSSFQLETTEAFRPRVAALLNLAPDHQDRYESFDAYAAAKARILANQTGEDAAVLGFDDPAVRALAERARARVVPFRTDGPLERGVWLDAESAVVRVGDATPRRVSLSGLRLAGAHHRANALAALAVAVALGVEPERAVSALPSFRGLPHRGDVVAHAGGITWVDDSKATNPAAALAALRGFAGPLVWIAGGRDKGLDFTPLADAARGRVREAIAYGEAAKAIERAVADGVAVRVVTTLEQAVERAARSAQPGDVVLLAPACASQDQFRDFAERGDRFRAYVGALRDSAGGGPSRTRRTPRRASP